jgi:glucosyl-dolichyl phosphate glucuronosyltransferase
MTDISIIVPTFNRAPRLKRTLNSVGTILESRDAVEIIVVDNGSTDGTKAVFTEAQTAFSKMNWRYFYESTPGLLVGRHRGATEASGEIFCYLDDDVLLGPLWFDAISEAFRNPAIDLVGGPSLPQYEAEPPEWLASL